MADSRRARLARLHSLSGLLVALFAAVHLMSQAAALNGPAAYGSFRALLRRVYQAPPVEILFLTLPILFSTASGLWLAFHRESTVDAPSLRGRLHRWSGLCMSLLVIPHALTTRGLDLIWQVDVGFHFVAGTLTGIGGVIFGLSYLLLTVATAFHLSNGLFTFFDDAGSFGGKASRRCAALALILVGSILLLAGVFGLLSFAGVTYPHPSLEPLPITRW